MTIVDEMRDMNAILDVWFGGTEGGNAVADVLFGDVNPSGKLTASFPVNVGQIPVYHSMLNTGRPNLPNYPKFRTNYLDAPNDPLLPFGFGLSYTSFEYGKPKISANTMIKGQSVSVTVSVKNAGKMAGNEIVHLYIRDLVGTISRPVKELKGFQKIYLQLGESKEVTFTINEELLKFYKRLSSRKWIQPTMLASPNKKSNGSFRLFSRSSFGHDQATPHSKSADIGHDHHTSHQACCP